MSHTASSPSQSLEQRCEDDSEDEEVDIITKPCHVKSTNMTEIDIKVLQARELLKLKPKSPAHLPDCDKWTPKNRRYSEDYFNDTYAELLPRPLDTASPEPIDDDKTDPNYSHNIVINSVGSNRTLRPRKTTM